MSSDVVLTRVSGRKDVVRVILCRVSVEQDGGREGAALTIVLFDRGRTGH